MKTAVRAFPGFSGIVALLFLSSAAICTDKTLAQESLLDGDVLAADGHQSEMVKLRVTVTDKQRKPVPSLPLAQFNVIDNKQQEKIAFFQNEARPASVGILVDTSGSARRPNRARDLKIVVQEIARGGVDSTQYFLLAFGDRLELLVDWTTDANRLVEALNNSKRGGETRLYDAVYAATEKVNRDNKELGVLIVISDGMDTASDHSFDQVHKILGRCDILLYSVALLGGPADSLAGFGTEVLSSLTLRTGGAFYSPLSEKEISAAAAIISEELRSQYVIGYYPTGLKRDGKWHNVRVEVRPLEIKDGTKPNSSIQHRTLSARTRRGYFAPRD
jgi:Ca-activated chloride channel family protein